MLSVDRIGGALLLVKAVDIAARGPVALPTPLWGLAMAGWVAGAVALVLGRVGPDGSRACWGGVLIAGTGFAVDYPLELGRQHLVLLLGVALVAVVARDVGERLLLWRLQLSALYGVAALAKLNESFLGGDVLAGAVRAAPFGSTLLPPLSPLLFVLAGIGLILVEVTLAVTPWAPRRRRPAPPSPSAFTWRRSSSWDPRC